LPRPKKSFSPEFKDEAVKMVIETSRPIARVAKELGINEGGLFTGDVRLITKCIE
jgi:transposase